MVANSLQQQGGTMHGIAMATQQRQPQSLSAMAFLHCPGASLYFHSNQKAREDPSTPFMLGTLDDAELGCLQQKPCTAEASPAISIRHTSHRSTDHTVERR